MEDSLLEAPRMTQTINDTTIDVKSLIRGIAGDYSEVLIAIGEAESNLKSVTGITGDRGVLQFEKNTWLENCTDNFDDAFDVRENIACGVKLLEQGEIWRWRASMDNWLPKLSVETRNEIKNRCQCVTYARNYLNLPLVEKADDLLPNSRPFIGAGVLFYKNHIGVIINMNAWGIWVRSGNCYNRCEICTKFYSWGSDKIRGFIK